MKKATTALEKFPNGKFAGTAKARTGEGIRIRQELEVIAHRIVDAVRRGDRAALDLLISDQFSSFAKGRLYNKRMVLAEIRGEPKMKSYQIEKTYLLFINGEPSLSYSVKYESKDNQTLVFRNELKFSKQSGQWKIVSWTFERQ